MNTMLTITAKGQVTLKRELLDHLGLKPGSQVLVEMGPGGSASLRAPPRGRIEDLFGTIPNNGVRLSIEEISDEIAKGWAGE